MIRKDDGFDLHIQWRVPCARNYSFAFITLFVFLLIIYANSFQAAFQFDDVPNIVENRNILIKSLDWADLKNTFYGTSHGHKFERPIAHLTFALNYYFDGLKVFGFHLVNFFIHYLTAVFLFLLLYKTLRLPLIAEKYGAASYGISLLATFFWATSPVQVTAVTYIVQRMASMAGLFYIMAMYFYVKGRISNIPRHRFIYFVVCAFCAVLSFGSKENAVMIPASIWIYDLLLIQGATRENLEKNFKLFLPVFLLLAGVGLWYVDIASILNGATYGNRPFTLTERLLTEPRVIVFYITLLLYPISSRLMLIHDIEISTSLFTPWSTFPAILLIFLFIVFALVTVRKWPLIAFCILFFFLNHVIEGSFIALELIYEHRNYIPSMFFFVPPVILIIRILDYFSYKKSIQMLMVVVFTFLLSAQGHTVFVRNTLFSHPLRLWIDNLEKAPRLSRVHNNLGAAYWDLGMHDKAYQHYRTALSLDRHSNLLNRGVVYYGIGMYHLFAKGDYEKAMGFFHSAIKFYPGYAPAYHNYAICLIHKGQLAEAGNKIVEALKLWPDDSDLRHSLSFVLLKAGKYDLAIKEARQALKLNPDHQLPLCVLAEAFRQKGNDALATQYWREYLKKNPNDLEGHLALIDLLASHGCKKELSYLFSHLTCIKGTKTWHELIDELKNRPNLIVYNPAKEKMLKIFRSNLAEDFRH